MSIQIVKVPDIGGDAVEVIEVCVAVGDQVAEEDSLVVLESDKASMEVPSPFSGTVKSIAMQVGDNVNEGATILELETEGEVAQDAAPDVATPAEEIATESEPAPVAQAPEPVVEPASGGVEVIAVPDIGGGEAEVIEVCVAAGDEIAEGDSMIVLETDKASMEVPAPKGGKVVSVSITEGGQASEGTTILELEVAGSAVQAAPAAEPEKTVAPAPKIETPKAEPAPVAAKPAATPASSDRKEFVGDAIYAGPAVRKIMREFGVDGNQVKPSGPKGRILKEDVQSFVKDALSGKAAAVTGGSGIPPIPAVDFSQFGEVDIKPLSKIAKVTAANMQRSWLNVPHVTQFDDADITELEDFRKGLKAEAERRGVKITPLPFLLKACANALRANPVFNSSLDETGENLVYKNYVHIGMAVDTPVGLMVPVIRDVDKKSIWDLAAETAELADKAKNRKLKPAEMQGGCFTISSLGGIGGTGFTPIVNAPEVAILGVSKLAVKPVWNGSDFEPRKMLPLAVSYDHRVVNGADAGRFFTYLTGLLADIRRMVL